MAANLVYKEEPDSNEESTIINLGMIDKILMNLKQIQFNILRAEEERLEFLKTNDMQAENNKKRTITELTTEISQKLTITSKLITDMKNELNRKADSMKVSINANEELRIENTIVSVFQAKVYELIKASSKLQLDVKDSYQDKIKRQIAVHAPNANEEQMEELMSKPEVK